MATWADTLVTTAQNKTGSTSIVSNSYTPPTAGGWVIIYVVSDATIPANPTMSSSADTTNPVRFIEQAVQGSGTSGVAVSIFMHRATSTAARTYTANFGGTSVVAKAITPVGFVTGSDIPDDSATVTDFCDYDHFGGGTTGTCGAGFLGTPPVRPMVLGFAAAAIEAPAGDSVSWSITETQSGAGGGNITSRGTTGSGAASNVSGAMEWSDTSLSSPDTLGNFSVTVTFGSSADCAAMVVRLLQIGTPTLQPTGIPSAGSVGTPTLIYNQTVSPDGIATAGAVGSPVVSGVQTVSPTGVSTAQALGTPAVTVFVQPNGIGTNGVQGNPTVVPGTVTTQADGIATAGALGAPTVFLGPVTLQPTGIPSAESLGDPRITVPPITVVLGDMSFEGFVGQPVVGTIVYLASTPTRQSYEVAQNSRLWHYFQETEGVTWYKADGVWQTGNYLAEDLPVDEIYRGGYEYEVTSIKADELAGLGFTIRTEFR